MFRKKESPTESRPDDITAYEPIKRLGIFVLQTVDGGSEGARMYGRAGVVADPRKSFVDIHLRPEADLEGVGPQAVRDSLGKVAGYIHEHPAQLANKEMVAVTYPKLGKLASHFGFEVTPVDGDKLPMAITSKITEIADAHGYAPKVEQPDVEYFEDGRVRQSGYGDEKSHSQFGEFAVLHQNTDEIAARYSHSDEQ